MDRRTVIFKSDGTKLVRDWDEGKRPDLKWLQQAVGGYIELCPGAQDGEHMYVNENGRLEGLPVNPQIGLSSQSLRGDVVVLHGFTLDEGEDEMICPSLGDPG